MAKYFGTDGIRGVVGAELDEDLAFKIGAALTFALRQDGTPKVLIGKDTRESSDILERAIISGICAYGGTVETLGIIPTPAVAFLTKRHGAGAGIVISASHNPYEYNGIKIFSSMGYKIPDKMELLIEKYIDDLENIPNECHEGVLIESKINPISEYVDYICSCTSGDLSGYKVLVDCANGASYKTAEQLFSKLNIDFKIINNMPNGRNINENCGSTHIDNLKDKVLSGGFDMAIAFDGDADRCLILDETGRLIDGDNIMAACAKHLKHEGSLNRDTFVATVMSNMGLHKFARENGLSIECTSVGDRFVLENMIANGYNLGGEQSGHVIFLDHITTGDGELTAVKFIEMLKCNKYHASEISKSITQYPQTLVNIRVKNNIKNTIIDSDELGRAISDCSCEFGESRILVRASGTEPLIRIMVEAEYENVVETIVERLEKVIVKLMSQKNI